MDTKGKEEEGEEEVEVEAEARVAAVFHVVNTTTTTRASLHGKRSNKTDGVLFQALSLMKSKSDKIKKEHTKFDEYISGVGFMPPTEAQRRLRRDMSAAAQMQKNEAAAVAAAIATVASHILQHGDSSSSTTATDLGAASGDYTPNPNSFASLGLRLDAKYSNNELGNEALGDTWCSTSRLSERDTQDEMHEQHMILESFRVAREEAVAVAAAAMAVDEAGTNEPHEMQWQTMADSESESESEGRQFNEDRVFADKLAQQNEQDDQHMIWQLLKEAESTRRDIRDYYQQMLMAKIPNHIDHTRELSHAQDGASSEGGGGGGGSSSSSSSSSSASLIYKSSDCAAYTDEESGGGGGGGGGGATNAATR
jgi:hypothetical protein